MSRNYKSVFNWDFNDVKCNQVHHSKIIKKSVFPIYHIYTQKIILEEIDEV